MKILKGILKTAKEMYNADSNGELGKYIGDKLANMANKYDGAIEEEIETQKDQELEKIKEELTSELFDNEYCQELINNWENSFATSDQDRMLVSYWRYMAWLNVFDSVSEARQEYGYEDKPDEEKEAFDEKEKEANAECLQWIESAINYLDEDNVDFWICTLFTAKAERLHWMGSHVEAVRLAIIALPYACDEDEKEQAKASITGKVVLDWDVVAPVGGYGIYGETPNAHVQRRKDGATFEYQKDDSLEDNEVMMELCAMELTELVEDDLYNKNELRWFSNRPYHERQFIFTVRDLNHISGSYDETDNIKYVFPLDELPGEITFPVGHPQPNTLYYAHPLRPMYLPFENAQLMLFYEKVHEMCRLFQCLGATQISARCLKGSKISREIITSSDVNAEGGYKVINASAGLSGKGRSSENRDSRNEMQLNQSFSPQKAPYCPNDLLWAKEDLELRTLIQQRFEGGLLEFTKKISSYETSNLSQNQVNDVKVAFQCLMANVSANYSASTDTTFSQTTETEWEISVQFKPLEEFKDYVSPKELKAKADARKGDLITTVSLFGNTKERGLYILDTLQTDIKVSEQVIVCTGDTEFDSEIEGIMMSFKMLPEGKAGDKVALFLKGITPFNIRKGTKVFRKRGTEHTDKENDTLNDEPTKPKESEVLTPEEEKYKEEILFCLEDNGTISEDDRRYLERKRKKFGISEERALEIEQEATPSLTENEKEYLETVKELASSGTLTNRAKRLLEHERESLNLSKERAEEIEKMAFNN